MSKSCCRRCRGWDFWDTDDQDKYHFFKVMVGDFRHQMTIPNKFAQYIRDKIQRTIKLKACNGNTCSIIVAKYSDKLVLKAGWATFVNSHDLKMGDFLVFRYNGDSQFNVKIFEPSGCVKASSHNAAKIGHHVQHRQGDASEILSSCDKNPLTESLVIERQNQLQTDGSNNCNKKMKTGHASSSEDDQEIPPATGYALSPFTHLTELHRMKVVEKVRAVHSNHPVFVAAMKKCNITRQPCYLGICRKYANEYLPREEQMVTLERQGKRWQVRFCITKRKLRILYTGWKKFTRDNELQIGDTCLFELLRNENTCTMNVHIIRK